MKTGKWIILVLLMVAVALIVFRKKAPSENDSSPIVSREGNAEGAVSDRITEVSSKLGKAGAVSGGTNAVEEALATEAGGRALQVIVQDEARGRLEGAEIRVNARGAEAGKRFNKTTVTGAQGVAEIMYPGQRFDRLELQVSKDEYSPRKMAWDVKNGDVVPLSWTLTLKKGVSVGGVVVDPESRPVAEAKVRLYRFWRGGEERGNRGEESEFPTQTHITGSDGRWAARNLPAELLHRIFIEGSHSNYISVQVGMEGKPEIQEQLRAGTHQLTLKRGLEVQGLVINGTKEPVAGAHVWAGRKYRRERQETTTDERGRFGFRNIEEGKLDFSVAAEGYAPAWKSHSVSANGPELVFQLETGAVIHGTVQEDFSRPVDGVRVVLEGSPGEDAYDLFEFSATTDNEGKFEWRSAPNAEMPFYFGKPGYEQRRNVKLKPAEDNIVTLKKNREINGFVLDAKTAQPITRFTVAVGRREGEDRFYADSGRTTEFRNDRGMFSTEIHEENSNAIQATAPGYADQVQSIPPAENGELRVVFNMQPSPALKGVVVAVDGQPVAGASVALTENRMSGRTVQWARGELRSLNSQNKIVRTDEQGAFEIGSPPEQGMVLAAARGGYGAVSVEELRNSGKIVLRELGRIEGRLLQGANPVAGQELMLMSPSDGLNFEYESTLQTTDAHGRFAFDKLPAGTFNIVRLIRTSGRSRAHSHSTEVVVRSGEVTEVLLGGANATLQGSVRLEGLPAEGDYILSAQLSTPSPRPPQNATAEEATAFYSSPAFQEQLKNMKYYTAAIGANGQLLLDSVEPGEYTLKVVALKADDNSFGMKPLAAGETTVSVPAGARPDAPIAVGEIALRKENQQ